MTFTYWYKSNRGFSNEYTIGIATSMNARALYRKHGFERINRDRAVKELRYEGDAATKPMVSVEFDGESRGDLQSPGEVAKMIKDGTLTLKLRGPLPATYSYFPKENKP